MVAILRRSTADRFTTPTATPALIWGVLRAICWAAAGCLQGGILEILTVSLLTLSSPPHTPLFSPSRAPAPAPPLPHPTCSRPPHGVLAHVSSLTGAGAIFVPVPVPVRQGPRARRDQRDRCPERKIPNIRWVKRQVTSCSRRDQLLRVMPYLSVVAISHCLATEC